MQSTLAGWLARSKIMIGCGPWCGEQHQVRRLMGPKVLQHPSTYMVIRERKKEDQTLEMELWKLTGGHMIYTLQRADGLLAVSSVEARLCAC